MDKQIEGWRNLWHNYTMKILNKIWFVVLLLCVSVAYAGAGAEGLSSTAGFAFTHNLTLGVRGSDVSSLQQFLIAGGFLKGTAPTGYFGPLTKAALGKWQASVGISPAAGFFGPVSRERINAGVKPIPITVIPEQGTVGTTVTVVATSTNGSPALPTGKPTRLKIPKINVDAGFLYTGLTPDGIMEIPNNIVDVGWFTGSVRPGEKGVAVVTGHVAQIRGGVLTKPGVFYNLKELGIGDTLNVINDKGVSIAFVVREIRNYDPAADATYVFTSSDGGIHLNLITCEGTWNPAQLSYSQRLVIFTDAVR